MSLYVCTHMMTIMWEKCTLNLSYYEQHSSCTKIEKVSRFLSLYSHITSSNSSKSIRMALAVMLFYSKTFTSMHIFSLKFIDINFKQIYIYFFGINFFVMFCRCKQNFCDGLKVCMFMLHFWDVKIDILIDWKKFILWLSWLYIEI